MSKLRRQINRFLLLSCKAVNITSIYSASTRSRCENNNFTTIWKPKNSAPMHWAKTSRRCRKWSRREATGMFNWTTIWPSCSILDMQRCRRPKRMKAVCSSRWEEQTWPLQQRIVPRQKILVSLRSTPLRKAVVNHQTFVSKSRPSNRFCRRKTKRPNKSKWSGLRKVNKCSTQKRILPRLWPPAATWTTCCNPLESIQT